MGPVLDPSGASSRPRDVGILAVEVYFPSLAVSQEELEKHDGVEGKYTRGLGQSSLALCGDQEDAVSMALSAASSLLHKYGVQPSAIGRLDVGTEADIDSAKTVKSFLMQLLGDNCDVEGSDHRAACYGGTAALLAAVDWVSGEGWDGRLAMVVTTDIPVYTEPGARATGGAGAVAMLVGPNAPLAVCRRSVSSHCLDTYDWYKPNGPVPLVDGKLSVATYLECLERCFGRLQSKCRQPPPAAAAEASSALPGPQPPGLLPESLDSSAVDYAVLHHPYNKLVQKGAARLAELLDRGCRVIRPKKAGGLPVSCETFRPPTLSNPGKEEGNSPGPSMEGASSKPPQNSTYPSEFYVSKVFPSTLLGRECGNMYTGSLYAALASLVADKGCGLYGSRILMYSFGSGAMSSMYFIKCQAPPNSAWDLGAMQGKLDLSSRLSKRRLVAPRQLEDAIANQVARHEKAGWEPLRELLRDSEMARGSYQLVEVDQRYRRRYIQMQVVHDPGREQEGLCDELQCRHGCVEHEVDQPCLKKTRPEPSASCLIAGVDHGLSET